MEKIKVFRSNRKLAITFLVFAAITVVFGIIVLVLDKKWSGSLFIVQGLLLGVTFAINLLNRKYYIEWDDSELRFLLPDTKTAEIIELSQIGSVKIRLFEIELMLPGRSRIINLESLEFEDLRKIKDKFEAIGRGKKTTG